MLRETYQFVNIPTSMLAFALGFDHALMRAEMPVHMSVSLLLTRFVGLETSSTLSAWCAKLLVEGRD